MTLWKSKLEQDAIATDMRPRMEVLTLISMTYQMEIQKQQFDKVRLFLGSVAKKKKK